MATIEELIAGQLQFIAASSELQKRAAQEHQKLIQQEKKAAAITDKVTNTLTVLVKAGCVDETQIKQAKAMLEEHEGTLSVVQMLVNKLASETVKSASYEAGTADRGIEKTAGLKPVTDSPYLGVVKPGYYRESDEYLRRTLAK